MPNCPHAAIAALSPPISPEHFFDYSNAAERRPRGATLALTKAMAVADHVVVHPHTRATPRPGRSVAGRRGVVVAMVMGLTMTTTAGIGAVLVHQFASDRATPAALRPPTPLESVSDPRPVSVTITTPSWTKVRYTVTAEALRSDFTLWRQMHFNDWDIVPAEIRRPAVRAMVRAHERALAGPNIWREMSASDWDLVPQPIRAMAYLRMIWYWAVAEDVGSAFGLDPRVLAQTVAAIVMTESWFEHRAVVENQWGNRDLGLAQCSDYCREEIAVMSDAGEISFSPTDSDYMNPWIATRVATVWFARELVNSQGDVDLAIRAYHRGQDAAMDEKGDAYLALVRRLRERYIQAQTASPTWRLLTRAIAPQ